MELICWNEGNITQNKIMKMQLYAPQNYSPIASGIIDFERNYQNKEQKQIANNLKSSDSEYMIYLP